MTFSTSIFNQYSNELADPDSNELAAQIATSLQPSSVNEHRTCTMPKRKKVEATPEMLKGWQQIAAFLGQPVPVAQRWATEETCQSREPVIPAQNQGL